MAHRKGGILIVLLMTWGRSDPLLAATEDIGAQISRVVELPAHRRLAQVRRSEGAVLSEFSTDGCSGGMSTLWTFVAESFPRFGDAHGDIPPWEYCCKTHDIAYHSAGEDPQPEASYDARLLSDERLRECVAETSSSRDDLLEEHYGLTPTEVRQIYAAVSAAMFHAVRAGGGPCTGLPWRWGYGYQSCWLPADQPQPDR